MSTLIFQSRRPEENLKRQCNSEVQTASQAVWAEWIQRISRGDEDSLCALYEAAVTRVYSVALHITRVPAVAEEVVQAVFFQVWRSANTFDIERGSPLAWLLVICRSQALAKLRSADIIVRHDNIESHIEEQKSEEDDPQSLLLAIEQKTSLHLALQTLCSRDRQLLALAFFRGFSHSEIAEQMVMPVGTVKSHIRLALLSLRRKLNPLDLRG
jgi:RNA polymerase sigma factor (sigma-70 family)